MPRLQLRPLGSQSAVIANGQTVSSAVATLGSSSMGIVLPAAFTGVALTFQVSADNTTYQILHDAANAAITMTVAQGFSYALPASVLSFPWFKIVSGSAEGAARTIVVAGKG